MSNNGIVQEKKKETVREMFNDIAPAYDFLNHFLSLGIDKRWRKKVKKLLEKAKPAYILDIAAGTADLCIALSPLKPVSIKGIDISAEMLHRGREKIQKRKLEGLIELIEADAEQIPFKDQEFDAAVVAFGVRNFENLQNGLNEIFRVLRFDGNLVVLEFSKPERFPVKQLYNLYFHSILPLAGRFISGNKNAYHYLPATVDSFPSGENFTKELEKAGFSDCSFQLLTYGIACVYSARKTRNPLS